MRKLILILFMALLCTNCLYQAKEDVLKVVTDYEKALTTYDSEITIRFMHPVGIERQFGSVENYHHLMKNAFDAIKSDGGIESTQKENVLVKDDVAYVTSTIITRQNSQTGELELRKLDGAWLIYKLP